MRRLHIVPFLLLPFAAVTPAHAQVLQLFPSNHVAAAGPDALVARLLSFDRNNDGRITNDELNERMKPLLARGDANGDRALDGGELRSLATAPVQRQVRGFPASGGYGFGDDTGFSSRLHIEGALDDLRLAAATRERALPVVRRFLDAWEASSRAALLKEMEAVLTAEQLADFSQKLDTEGARIFPPDLRLIVQNLTPAETSRLEGLLKTNPVLTVGPALAQYHLTPEQTSQARGALDRFNSVRRLGDAERSALLDRMTSILSDEEFDNFRAALERRPLVKAGTAGRIAVSGQFTSGQNVRMIGFAKNLRHRRPPSRHRRLLRRLHPRLVPDGRNPCVGPFRQPERDPATSFTMGAGTSPDASAAAPTITGSVEETWHSGERFGVPMFAVFLTGSALLAGGKALDRPISVTVSRLAHDPVTLVVVTTFVVAGILARLGLRFRGTTPREESRRRSGGREDLPGPLAVSHAA